MPLSIADGIELHRHAVEDFFFSMENVYRISYCRNNPLWFKPQRKSLRERLAIAYPNGITVGRYDRQKRQQVSGEVGERQESVKAVTIAEGSTEASGTS